MSSSFSSPYPQLSISWLPLWSFSPLLSLPSEPCTQSDITPLLPLVEAGAATPPHASIVFLTAAFQESWYYFVNYQRGWEKT